MKIHPQSSEKLDHSSWPVGDQLTSTRCILKVVPKLCTRKELVIVRAKNLTLSISFTYLDITHVARSHKAYLIAKLPKSSHFLGCIRFFSMWDRDCIFALAASSTSQQAGGSNRLKRRKKMIYYEIHRQLMQRIGIQTLLKVSSF